VLPSDTVHRGRSIRSRRYPLDTTDDQWAELDPLLPDPAWLTGNGGRPETHCRRQIVDAIFYLVDNGITWHALPADFPPLVNGRQRLRHLGSSRCHATGSG
jgi:transposase